MSDLLHDRVAQAAEAHAGATAVVMGDERLTYEELEQQSDAWAQLLRDAGVGRGDRVALVQPKAPAAIVSMLATLKVGAIYVPVDIATPAERIERVLTSAEPRLLLASAAAQDLVERLGLGVPTGCVDGRLPGATFDARDASGRQGSPPRPSLTAQDPAHLLFTSGSTGVPKGVVITHAMVAAFLDWALPHFGHRAGDRISGHPPLHFDLSTFDIYGSLSAGAELHLVPPNVLLPRQLAEYIRRSELTQWFSVPSTFAYMARFGVVEQDDFPSVERIIWCGEVLPTPVLAHWMHRVPRPTYTNLYGPTEATIASSFHTVAQAPADESVPVPIGRPCGGEDLVVLDEELRPVPDGELGELYIAGAGLSPGYWRDEAKTAAAFVTEPGSGRRLYRTGDLGRRDADGVLHFVGRVDSQIKSRGYRIELGEIEVALASIDGVAECAVVGVASEGFEGTAICAAWVPNGGAHLERQALRAELTQRLPSYMVPTGWLELEELPKNVNGKTDRPALRALFASEVRGA